MLSYISILINPGIKKNLKAVTESLELYYVKETTREFTFLSGKKYKYNKNTKGRKFSLEEQRLNSDEANKIISDLNTLKNVYDSIEAEKYD